VSIIPISLGLPPHLARKILSEGPCMIPCSIWELQQSTQPNFNKRDSLMRENFLRVLTRFTSRLCNVQRKYPVKRELYACFSPSRLSLCDSTKHE
jgi:hypothetical protein